MNFLQLSIESLKIRKFDHNRKAGKTGLSEIEIRIPAIFENKKFVGFDIELLKEIAERSLIWN